MKTAKIDNADVVVLGGGFAGLTAAICLARAKHKVTLLEAEATLGGKAGEYKADGYRFDTGPHLLTLPDVFLSLFAENDFVQPPEILELEPITRYFFPSGKVWDVFFEPDANPNIPNLCPRTTAILSQEEKTAYLALRQAAKKLFSDAANTFVYNQAPSFQQLLRYGIQAGWRAHPLSSLQQLLSKTSNSPEINQFFLRFATYFGANPYRAPAILQNIAWAELGYGGYYPRGGIVAMIKAMEDLATALGVKIIRNTKVQNLVTSQKHIQKVKTNNGTYKGKWIVSTLDILRTYELLGKKTVLHRKRPSLSGYVLLLGLTGETPNLQHHNIIFCQDYRQEFTDIEAGRLPQDPTIYISISSKTQLEDAPQGCENWFVLVNAPPEGWKESTTQANQNNHQEYAKNIINILEKRGFNIKKRIQTQHVLPPSHLARFATYGSIYGTAPHSLLDTLRPKPRIAGIQNLRLAGGTVHPGGGMPLAILSGKQAAEYIIEEF